MAATPPAPRRGRRPRPFLIALIVAAGAATWVWGFCAYATHDRLQFIDRDATIAVARRSCDALRTRLDRIAQGGVSGERRIEAENRAVGAMIAEFTALGGDVLRSDSPVISWLADWRRLSTARAAHVDAHGLDRPLPFAVPLDDDGKPIVVRMNDLARDSGLPQCVVPRILLRPSAAAISRGRT